MGVRVEGLRMYLNIRNTYTLKKWQHSQRWGIGKIHSFDDGDMRRRTWISNDELNTDI